MYEIAPKKRVCDLKSEMLEFKVVGRTCQYKTYIVFKKLLNNIKKFWVQSSTVNWTIKSV